MAKQKIRNRAAVIAIDGDKILLVKHHKYDKEYWLLPGGGVDYGETLQEAARRELLEETGLNATIGDLLFISESIPSDQHRHVINYYFEATVTGGKLFVGDDTQLVDTEWFPIKDLPNLTIYPNVVPEIFEWIKTKNVQPKSLGNRWD